MQNQVISAWADRELLNYKEYNDAVHAVIEELDKGRLRVAQKKELNGW